MRRVAVVTGMGVVTPIGIDVPSYWQSSVDGRSGLRREERFEMEGLPCGPVTGHIGPEDTRRLRDRGPPGLRWGDSLIRDAIEQALADAALAPGASAAVILSELGGMTPLDFGAYAARLQAQPDGTAHGQPRVNGMGPIFADISERLGRPVVPLTFEATCATGARMLAEAARLIETGAVEVAVAAVVSARLTPYTFATYAQLGALTRWRGPPEEACRPFDQRRDGMVLAEGAGCIVLESAAHAERRGREPIARLSGFGFSNGGTHFTAPDPRLMEAALRGAMERAGLGPDDFDVVNTHGTSTRLNDLNEARTLRTIFGERVSEMGFAACKSVLGHLSIAAGVVESVAAVMTLRTGIVPPVPTCTEPDPACALPVRREAFRRPVRHVLKNAFGFGGQYGALVFSRP